MTIKNREELVNELAEMLMQFDKDCNSYQTDVYFYYDNRTQTGSLDTFTNVGGNSWLDDDHMTIYRDREHYDDGAYSFFTDSDVIADILGITEEQLIQETKEHYGYDDDEDVGCCEIKRYVQSVEEYNNEIWEAYYEVIEENAADYCKQAEEIITNVEAIPYFTNEYGDTCLIGMVFGSNADIIELNNYAEKYSTEHEVNLEELEEILTDEGILEYDRYSGCYTINN